MNDEQVKEAPLTKPYKDHLYERLQTPEEISGYVAAAFEDYGDDPQTIGLIFQDIIRAKKLPLEIICTSPASPEGVEAVSRLIKLAARILRHEGFLSPHAEDNPASKKVLKIAEQQNEQCRLWAIEAREIADSLRRHVTPAPASSQQWEPKETAPRDGSVFRAYDPSLAHPDFNPWGQVEAIYDGDRFIGAVWDGQFDCWNTVPIEFTYWSKMPPSPEVQG